MNKSANVILGLVALLVLLSAPGCRNDAETGGEADGPASPTTPAAQVTGDSGQKPPLAGESTATEPASLRFVLSPFRPPVLFQVDSIKPDGSAHVRVQVPEQWAIMLARQGIGPEMMADLSEGYFVGLNGLPQMPGIAQGSELPADLKVFRVQVTEVEEGGAAWIHVGPDAVEQLKAGDKLYLARPGGSSTAQLKAVPDIVPLTDARSEGLGMDPRTAARLTQSQNNLKQIGLAMHNFHDAHKQFPPAAIFGPDGKPWHSWRVLLLPYVEEIELYNQYKFDEPWDGPNNRQLLDKMPAVYRDPLYGEDQGHFTHYAVVTGPGAAFPEGAKFDGKNLGTALAKRSGATRFADIHDGLSNTLLAGSVSPDRKIPWMKPEDVTFDDAFPAPGRPGSFAAPCKTDTGTGGVFLFGDGSVRAIRDDIDLQTWRNLFRIADGQVLGDVPELHPRPARPQLPVIEIRHTDAGPTARLVLEILPSPQSSPPPRTSRAPGPPPETAPVAVAEEATEVPEAKPVGGPETMPVRGTVILDGAPVEGATVRFKPRAGGREAVGVTDADGRFALTTSRPNDGAVKGMYGVTVSKKVDETTEMLPKKYSDPNTSALTVEVMAGANEFTFELRSD